MKFEEYLWPVVMALFTVYQLAFSHNTFVLNYKSFRRRKQMRVSSVIVTVYQTSLVRCMKKCAQYRRCGAITFNFPKMKCELGVSTPSVYTVSDVNIMTSANSWTPPMEIVGRCGDHNCTDTEMCIDFTNMPIQCKTVECLPYVGMQHSITTTVGARSIGMEFPIVCPQGYLPTINKTTCGRNGQWTAFSNVICLNCSTPVYENHVIVSCYNYPSLEKQTYAAAKNVCEVVGGKVPRIDSVQRDSYFRTVTDGLYWIEGGTETDIESMRYDDGTLITYKNYNLTNMAVADTTTTQTPFTDNTTTNTSFTNVTIADTAVAYTHVCGVDDTKCGIALSSVANDNQMYIRDKNNEPQLVVCQMVI